MRLSSKHEERDFRPLVRFLNNPSSVVVCGAPEGWETATEFCVNCGNPIKVSEVGKAVKQRICVKCGENLYIPEERDT